MTTHRKFLNALVVGKTGSGKSALCSLLNNPVRVEGCYFLDPIFVSCNIRNCFSRGISFIDTNGLSGMESDADNLSALCQRLENERYHITTAILCMRFGRVKPIDTQIISVFSRMVRNLEARGRGHAVTLHVHVSGTSIPCEEMKTLLCAAYPRLAGATWTWLKLEFSGEFDVFGGQWMNCSDPDLMEDVKKIIYNTAEAYGGLN